EQWFVFTHPISGQHYRLNQTAYELIGRLDGEHTLDVLWTGLQRIVGDDAPTQDEVIAMLVQLLEIGLILFDRLPDLPVLAQRQKLQRRRERTDNLNPLAFRLRLFNPDPLLKKLSVWGFVLLHPVAIWLWCGLTGWALLHTILSWDEIHAYASAHLLTPRCLFLAWLAYPVMKCLHELGHGIAVHYWGGTVKEAGVGFFLLTPAPYVDASAATAFGTKWQRVAVSFAGIAVELALAAVALGLWSITETGVVRDMALVVMAIGGLSTILFNGNPLLRFDGYYILCDILELPNLASRSQQWWAEVMRSYLGGGQRGRSNARLQAYGSEHLWLMLYGPASWAYRVVISVVIVQWVAVKSVWLGLMAMLWLAFLLLLRPFWRGIAKLFSPIQSGRRGWHWPVTIAGVMTAALAALFFLPVPVSTIGTGVVWLPEQSQVRTENDAQVRAILARDGQQVRKGQALVTLDEPTLFTEKRRLQAQIASAETQQADAWKKEAQQGRDASDQVVRLENDLAQLEARLAGLTLHAEVDGTFVMPNQDEMIGRHVPKGTLIAYVLARDDATVRVAVSQDDIARIRAGVQTISVHLAGIGGRYFKGRLLRLEPAATRNLPGKAIGDHGGGSMVTDPADPSGLTTVEPFFLVDVQLPGFQSLYSGGRAMVRFGFDDRPLADTIAWRLRQLFLKTFAMAGQ
ncbi:MAG: PqqD family peptide modification chaperone, partial [Burkholderiaceae bacterium]